MEVQKGSGIEFYNIDFSLQHQLRLAGANVPTPIQTSGIFIIFVDDTDNSEKLINDQFIRLYIRLHCILRLYSLLKIFFVYFIILFHNFL